MSDTGRAFFISPIVWEVISHPAAFTSSQPIYCMLSVIAPCYNSYPILLPSLLLQTHTDWELILIHDGPDSIGLDRIVEGFNDPRVRLAHTPQRHNDWGHSLRAIGLKHVNDADFILHSNHDNYYTPTAFKFLLQPFANREIVGVYCDMVHSHYAHNLRRSQLSYSHIDCGAIVLRADAAKEIGWKSRQYAADWKMIVEAKQRYGVESFAKISKPLFVHN